MRTTLTIDPDVEVLLKRLQARTRAGLKEIVNEALRAGLSALDAKAKPTKRHRTVGIDLGQCLIGNIDDIAEALAVADGDHHQ